MMNIGAKADDPKKYNAEKAKNDVNPLKIENNSIKNHILSQLSDSFNWLDERGNTGDNVPKSELNQFHEAILNENPEKAVKFGFEVLECQMHPTARDIITPGIKTFFYNICNNRAYTYELEE